MHPITPFYWHDAAVHLSRDPVMRELISRFSTGTLQSRGDPFHTLARSIVGQQISVQSADAVWSRFRATLSILHPDAVLLLEDETLRACGLSRQKISYLRHLSHFFRDHAITSQNHWEGMVDTAVIAHLTQIKGIGRWSAEMFLMFCLMRPDVYPLDDIGLQRALLLNYGVIAKPFDRKAATVLAENWQPYRSVATWYLWRSIDPSDVAY
jgi:DNA-3-methyladenine glycosylase II